jgi:hypothetical protein
MGYKAVWRKPDVSEELPPSRGAKNKPRKKPAEVDGNLVLLFFLLLEWLFDHEDGCFVTLVSLRTTRRHNPEEFAVRSHRSVSLRPNIY